MADLQLSLLSSLNDGELDEIERLQKKIALLEEDLVLAQLRVLQEEKLCGHHKKLIDENGWLIAGINEYRERLKALKTFCHERLDQNERIGRHRNTESKGQNKSPGGADCVPKQALENDQRLLSQA
jgi:hypothetical protein